MNNSVPIFSEVQKSSSVRGSLCATDKVQSHLESGLTELSMSGNSKPLLRDLIMVRISSWNYLHLHIPTTVLFADHSSRSFPSPRRVLLQISTSIKSSRCACVSGNIAIWLDQIGISIGSVNDFSGIDKHPELRHRDNIRLDTAAKRHA